MGAVQSTDEDNDSGDRRRHHQQQQQRWRRTNRTEMATTLKPLHRRRHEPCSDDDNEGLCDSSGDDGYDDGDVEEECRGGKTMTTPVTATDVMPQVAPTMTKTKAILPMQTIVEISDREVVRQHLIALAYPPGAIEMFLTMARSIVVSDASQASISTMLPLIPLDVRTAKNPYKLAVSVHAKLQEGSYNTTAALLGEEPRRPTAHTYMEGIVMGAGGFGRAAEPHHAAWVYDVAGRAVLDPMSISGCHETYPITGPLRYIGVSIVYSTVLKKTIPEAALVTRALFGHHGSGAGRAGPSVVDMEDIGGYQVSPKGLIRSGLIVLE